jgi:Ca2+-binding EF-hand superfamily protein
MIKIFEQWMETEKKGLFRLFKYIFDQDNDNYVTYTEFINGLELMGIRFKFTINEIEGVFKQFNDQKKDGRMSYQEFVAKFSSPAWAYALDDHNHWSYKLFC